MSSAALSLGTSRGRAGLGVIVEGRWPVALALAVLAVLAYANALVNGFVLDDRGIVLDNPLVREPGTAWRAFLTPYWPAAIGGGQYRPLGILSFALDSAIAGPSAIWYHAVNVAWHAAATVLLWVWIRGFLAPAGALVAAALFAVHPVHVEAVANVVGRLELMAATFIFAALVAHRRGSWFAPVLFACALLSKEHAVVFIPLAFLSHLIEPGSVAAMRARGRLWMAYAVITVLWLGLMVSVVRDAPAVTSAVFHGLATPQRLLTVVSVIPEYVRLLLVPLQLSADYEPGVIRPALSVLSAPVLVGAAVLVTYAWITTRAWRTNRVAAFALLAIPIALAPVSNVFFVTGVALAERTLYLPSAFVCILGGLAVERFGHQRAAISVAGALIVLAAAELRTWTRTPVWRDARTFAVTLLEDHPESYRGHWVAGRVLFAAGDLGAAQRELALARRIHAHDVALNREAARVDSIMTSRRPAVAAGTGDAQ